MATKKTVAKSKYPKEIFCVVASDGNIYTGEFFESVQELVDTHHVEGTIIKYQLVGTGTIKSTFVENK